MNLVGTAFAAERTTGTPRRHRLPLPRHLGRSCLSSPGPLGTNPFHPRRQRRAPLHHVPGMQRLPLALRLFQLRGLWLDLLHRPAPPRFRLAFLLPHQGPLLRQPLRHPSRHRAARLWRRRHAGQPLENPDPLVTIVTANQRHRLLPHRHHDVPQPRLHRQRHLRLPPRLDAPRLAQEPRPRQPPRLRNPPRTLRHRKRPSRPPPRRSPHELLPSRTFFLLVFAIVPLHLDRARRSPVGGTRSSPAHPGRGQHRNHTVGLHRPGA